MDDDDQKFEGEAAEPADERAEDAAAKLREISEDELKQILEAHRTWVETSGKEGARADLKGANLQGADLRSANLHKANFQGANLREAKLQGAFLTGADLWGADLCGANLEKTLLDGANLKGANLRGAVLSRANLQGANLVSANLQDADLQGANLVSGNLQRASLLGANLRSANLQGANLRGANLRSAELGGANLQDANLSYTKFRLAHLLDTNLQNTDLFLADLQEAFLIRADLRGAKATEANLQEAKLIEADLERANLSDADLRNADLSDAKLSDVIGLRADQLAGADLANAKLPKEIAEFDGLSRVAEISGIARPIFIGILAGCVYSWLTIATTTDTRLLTNSTASPLPIIGTEIPIAGFYLLAPILLLAVYVYLQLYLQRLWAGLADLPAVFPDGSPLNKKIYPWLLSGLVRAHFKLLKDKRSLLSRLENWATIFLAWWIVPVTVAVFWGRYLPRHEWFGTGLHVALLIVSIGTAILLHQHAAGTLRRDVTAFRWRRPWSDRRTYQGAVAVGLGAVFALVSLGAIEGEAYPGPAGVVVRGIAIWVPDAFDANLREADVSTKPATWTGLAERPSEELEKLDKTLVEKARAELALVKGAQLQGADLRRADAVRAFLVKADLAGANLQGADLRSANLQGADLRGANLEGAHLFRANLQGTRLKGADLTKVKGLTREQLDEACGDQGTVLPDNLADYYMKACPTLEYSPSN